jgi:hypothetical protein
VGAWHYVLAGRQERVSCRFCSVTSGEIVSLFFRPSVPLYYEFVQGRTEPYAAYLVCGPDASGYCLGACDLIVHVPTKRVIPVSGLPSHTFTASHPFDCLSFYSFNNPHIQVASADTRLVRAKEIFKLDLLVPVQKTSYDEDLQKVISA